MRLLVLSDLHLERAPFEPAAADADVVVLAGDIHNGPRAVGWAREAFPRHPIVQVAGNHEFYDGEHGSTLDAMRRAAREAQVCFLENEAVVLEGVRFLGCTLWSDFRLFEAPGRPLELPAARAMEANRRLIADYRAIGFEAPEGSRRFDPADAARLHAESVGWLDGALAQAFPGPTVVVTHHLPSWRSVHPDFAAWISNASFASDLDHLVARSDCWIHGHTHASRRYRLGRAEVACNPRGYPRPPGFENPGFEPGFCIEVATMP